MSRWLLAFRSECTRAPSGAVCSVFALPFSAVSLLSAHVEALMLVAERARRRQLRRHRGPVQLADGGQIHRPSIVINNELCGERRPLLGKVNGSVIFLLIVCVCACAEYALWRAAVRRFREVKGSTGWIACLIVWNNTHKKIHTVCGWCFLVGRT